MSLSLVIRRGTLLMEWRLLIDFFFGIFPHEVKDINLREVRLNPHEVRLKQTLENMENSEKLKIPFWVEGTFGDYIWSVYLLQVQCIKLSKNHQKWFFWCFRQRNSWGHFLFITLMMLVFLFFQFSAWTISKHSSNLIVQYHQWINEHPSSTTQINKIVQALHSPNYQLIFFKCNSHSINKHSLGNRIKGFINTLQFHCTISPNIQWTLFSCNIKETSI